MSYEIFCSTNICHPECVNFSENRIGVRHFVEGAFLMGLRTNIKNASDRFYISCTIVHVPTP